MATTFEKIKISRTNFAPSNCVQTDLILLGLKQKHLRVPSKENNTIIMERRNREAGPGATQIF